MKHLLALCKIRISLLSTLSFAAGWVLASGRLSRTSLVLIAGTLFLACGALALNQVQERTTDALMERTRNRPLPAGRIAVGPALGTALSLVVAGLCLLSLCGNVWVPGLGLLALVWYNGIYTPMKKWTPWAAVPGALVGALPPVMGWVAAGGLPDPRILAVAFFMFLWQIPHSWLLVLQHPQDYERAGFPTAASVFSREQLERVTFVWILSSAMACLVLPVFGVARSVPGCAALAVAAFGLGWRASSLVRKNRRGIPFQAVHLFALFVITLISLDGLLNFP